MADFEHPSYGDNEFDTGDISPDIDLQEQSLHDWEDSAAHLANLGDMQLSGGSDLNNEQRGERRAIVAHLRQSGLSLSQIAEELNIPLTTVRADVDWLMRRGPRRGSDQPAASDTEGAEYAQATSVPQATQPEYITEETNAAPSGWLARLAYRISGIIRKLRQEESKVHTTSIE